MVYCANCGRELNVNEKFCTCCGTPSSVGEVDNLKATVPQKPQKLGYFDSKELSDKIIKELKGTKMQLTCLAAGSLVIELAMDQLVRSPSWLLQFLVAVASLVFIAMTVPFYKASNIVTNLPLEFINITSMGIYGKSDACKYDILFAEIKEVKILNQTPYSRYSLLFKQSLKIELLDGRTILYERLSQGDCNQIEMQLKCNINS